MAIERCFNGSAQRRTLPCLDIEAGAPPEGFRSSGGIRRSMLELLLEHDGVHDVQLYRPQLPPHMYGRRTRNQRRKITRDCRERFFRSLNRLPFITTQSLPNDRLRCALDTDALHDPSALAQALLAVGHRNFQAMTNEELLQGPGAGSYASRARSSVSVASTAGHIRSARGYVGEAALHHMVTTLADALPMGQRGQIDSCWFEEPTAFDIGNYRLIGQRNNVRAERAGRSVFEQDAMLLLGDRPDGIALVDVTISQSYLEKKIRRGREFQKFRACSRKAEMMVHRIHVLLHDHLDGWCNVHTGEGSSKVSRAIRPVADAARHPHNGVMVVALPYRKRVLDIVENVAAEAQRSLQRLNLQKERIVL